MKILIISPSDLPIPAVKGGAVETGIQQILQENEKAKENQIDIVSYFDEKAIVEARKYEHSKFYYYKCVKIDKLLNIFLRMIRRILKNENIQTRPLYCLYISRVLKKNKYDAILLKNGGQYIEVCKKNSNARIYYQLHNDFLNANTKDAKKIFNNVDTVVVNSEYIKRRVLTIDGADKERVRVNMNCLDGFNFIETSENEKKDWIEKFNIEKDKKYIIFVGRLIPQKGIKELVQALSKLRNEDSWRLLIVGSKWFGKNKKTKYEKEIEKESTKIKDRIVFTGFIKREDIRKLYAISKIAVAPSMWEEPAGRVVLEAQSAGLPIILSDAGGMKEYATEESAIIVDRGKNFTDELAKQILLLLNNDDLCEKMGKAGRENSKKYTTERYYREIIEIMRK